MITYAIFGKLIAHGDFISRGLSKAEVEAIDNWLSASMEAAKRPEWQLSYDAAPPWQFARRALDQENWEAGAIALCVDKVGRRFPILAFGKNVPANMIENITENCEEKLYDAIGKCWTADNLWEELIQSNVAATKPWEQDDKWWTNGNETFAAKYIAEAQPDYLIAAMLAQDEWGSELAVQN
jgi:type VI secretion system ImpM family protein